MPSRACLIPLFLSLAGDSPPRARSGDPPVRILARLAQAEESALEACLAKLTKTRPELSGIRFRIRNVRPGSELRLPASSAFDIAVAFPVLELELGARRHKLLPIEEGEPAIFHRVLRIVPYGPLGASGWSSILNGEFGELLLPDPIVEAEFEEALAALFAMHGKRSLVQLRDYGTRVSLLDSAGIRERLADSREAIGIVALTEEECTRAASPLPAARLGIAVSSAMREPELGKRLLAWLVEQDWWRPSIGLPAGKSVPGLAFRFATLEQRVEADRLWRAVDAPPRESDEEWPWLDSLLLFGFSGAFLLLLLAACRGGRQQ